MLSEVNVMKYLQLTFVYTYSTYNMYSSSTCIFNVESHILLVTLSAPYEEWRGCDDNTRVHCHSHNGKKKKCEKATASSGTERPEDTVMIGDVATADYLCPHILNKESFCLA